MPPPLWFVLGLVAGYPLGIFCHELGHALSARLLGMRVREFSIGAGKRWLDFSWAGVRFLISFGRNCGHVCVDLPTGRAAIPRYATMIAAGPATNLLLALLVFVTANWQRGEMVMRHPLSALWLGWGVANLLLVGYAASLDDVDPSAASQRSSDGQKLSKLRRAPGEFMARWRLRNRIAGLYAEMQKTRGVPKVRGVCDGFAALAELAPAADYAAGYEALLRHPKVLRGERLGFLDEYCTWALFRGEQPYLDRAVVLSDELFAARGREITVQGTRGSMLAVSGRLDEAEAMLLRVTMMSKSPVDHAIATAMLAWLEHLRGHADAAGKWSASACEINKSGFPIPWMAAEMESASAARPSAQSSNTSV